MRATLLALLAAAGFVAVDRIREADHRHAVRVETGADMSESWDWRGTVASGKTLEIRSLSGSIRVEPASGSQVEVTAEKSGEGADPAGVRIAVVEHAGGVTICAVYPGDGNECRPGGGRMNVRGNAVEVDFVARVPAGVAVKAGSVSGDVSASGVAASVDVSAVSGDVLVEDSRGDVTAQSVSGDVALRRVDGSDVSAHTVSGDVEFSGPIRSGGSYQLKTLSGDLTVGPEGVLNADVSVSTFSGELDTDFPVTLAPGSEGRARSFRFAAGRGGARLDLESFSGTIYLRRAAATSTRGEPK